MGSELTATGQNLDGGRRILALGALVVMVGTSLLLLIPRLQSWPLAPDLTAFWTGARFAMSRPHDVYNWIAVTAAQMDLRPPVGPLPFFYPPSSLPLFTPFGLLPFWPAFWLWTLLSAVAFASAARRITSSWPLVFAAPHVILDLLLGQTTLWVGTLLIWGVTLLRPRPALAGVLLGLAAAIKPQFAIMVPVALLTGRHWVATAGSIAGFGAMVLLSLLFGPFLWKDWLSVVGGVTDVVAVFGLNTLGASPMMALRVLGLPHILHILFVALAIWLVWRAFRTDDVKRQVLVLIAATLLATPYALRYELGMLAPSLVDALMAGTVRGLIVALPIFCLNVLTIVPALVISALTAVAQPRYAV